MATTLLHPSSSSAPKTVGDKFSTDRTYAAGEYCIHKNTMYIFTADKDEGEWDDSVVEATTIAAELSQLNEKKSIVLWENSDPTQFTSSTITLSSDDYDYLKIYFLDYSNGYLNYQEILKGYSAILCATQYNSNGGVEIRYRTISYVDDLNYTATGGYYCSATGSPIGSGAVLVPLKIMSGHF